MMYSKGTVAPSTNEYKNVMLTTRVLKVDSMPKIVTLENTQAVRTRYVLGSSPTITSYDASVIKTHNTIICSRVLVKIIFSP
jgi:hypothetical protein